MSRFAWMQFRAQVFVATGGLIVLAIVLGVTGPHLVHLYDTSVATCGPQGDCPTADSLFLKIDHPLQIGLNTLVVVLPAIIGLFWGPPLVARELETGTFRLAWTQSVTRTRWLAAKLMVSGLAAVVLVGLASLMVTWWSSPIDRVNMSVFSSFDQRDLTPIGYALFALALGAAAGTVIRRTLPAMVTTLIVFVTVRLSFIHWIRPHLMAPALRRLALDPASTGYGSSGLLAGASAGTLQPSPPDIPNAWINAIDIVDRTGHPLPGSVLHADCPGVGSGGGGPTGLQRAGIGSGNSASHVPAAVQQSLQNCVSKVGATYHELVAYQPGSRYWAFQWYEMIIYLVAAVILAGLSLWWIRRRLT